MKTDLTKIGLRKLTDEEIKANRPAWYPKITLENMETKKVIEQTGIITENLNIEIVFRPHGINLIQHAGKGEAVEPDDVFIQYKNRTEVAKAICPKYQELEDRITHLSKEYYLLSIRHEELKKTSKEWCDKAMKKEIGAFNFNAIKAGDMVEWARGDADREIEESWFKEPIYYTGGITKSGLYICQDEDGKTIYVTYMRKHNPDKHVIEQSKSKEE